ncbi:MULTISPECIES: SMEK domain-containing protein [unclassified Providencia]|uniref:SMEK domain-containing protein n=1 Tax=unclassified Providencia TaxID=2633465 RepID=UPI00234A730E|nr:MULTISPECIES: SMEK domain-containing protein [unclassified Providencia]
MKIEKEELLKKISEFLTIFENSVTHQNSIGFTDINKSAETLFISILNKVYGYNLRDMNILESNYPAIDLADYGKKVCIQVTSENSREKIKKTIKKFNELSLGNNFSQLVFFIISNDKRVLNISDVTTSASIYVKNFTTLFKDISNLPFEDVKYIEGYFERNVKSRWKEHSSILRPQLLNTGISITFKGFINFLNVGSDLNYKNDVLLDINNLIDVLSKLTKNQREYLYYIVSAGKFEGSSSRFINKEKIIMPAMELHQEFHIDGKQICNMLVHKNLVYLDEEYDLFGDDNFYQVIVPNYGEKSGRDLFANFKEYLNDNNDLLKSLILDVDFSVLN